MLLMYVCVCVCVQVREMRDSRVTATREGAGLRNRGVMSGGRRRRQGEVGGAVLPEDGGVSVLQRLGPLRGSVAVSETVAD